MQYRTFGRTGWRVSEIGLGMMPLSGMYAEISDDDAVRVIRHALDRGINFIDAALMYGNGRAHRLIAKALKQWTGDRVYVATKVEPIQWPHPLDGTPAMRSRYPDWHLRHEVERSLKHLETDRIDLLQLHCWIPRGTTELDWLETLNDLKIQGKIDRIGVSIRDHRPEDGVDLARLGLVDSHQVVFNIFDQRPADELFRVGEATGTAFLARVPFDSSSLIGNWTPDSYDTWEEGTLRRGYFGGKRFMETYHRVEKLKELVEPYFPSLAEAAMRYCLSDPAVSVVIPGMGTTTEVDLDTAYSDGKPFPEELKNALADHRWPRNFHAPDPDQEDPCVGGRFPDV